jgi:prepilin-type N-terminal cleavage/methylation domain-containing protein
MKCCHQSSCFGFKPDSQPHATNLPGGVPRRRDQRAFSLIEVLLAVSIMSVIVFGLFSMFNQTQKALLATSKQVDILGSGRVAIDLLVDDIQQAQAPGLPLLSVLSPGTAELPHMLGTVERRFQYQPILQKRIDHTPQMPSLWTNILQNVFFLTQSNQNWVAKGFFFSPNNSLVASPDTVSLGFGTLFRFAAPNADLQQANPAQRFFPKRRLTHGLLNNLWEQYNQVQTVDLTQVTNPVFNATVSPLIEGVVHFKLQPIDSDGRPMLYYTNYNAASSAINLAYPQTILEREETSVGVLLGQTRYRFYGDSLPAFMELELGVLDPEVLVRVKSMPNLDAARQFLEDKPEAVHLFRRMIPLSTAKPIELMTP